MRHFFLGQYCNLVLTTKFPAYDYVFSMRRATVSWSSHPGLTACGDMENTTRLLDVKKVHVRTGAQVGRFFTCDSRNVAIVPLCWLT
jgi:hypothetical protein